MNNKDNKKVLIISSGIMPIPASQGGAVENLVENLIKQNEKDNKIDLSICSIYDKTALNMSVNYRHTKFFFIKSNVIVELLDQLLFFVSKYILKKKNIISYRHILRRLLFINKYKVFLLKKKSNYDRIVLLTNTTLYMIFKNKKIREKYLNRTYFYLHNSMGKTFDLENYILESAGVIGVSQYVINTFCNKLPSFDKKKCYVLKNCIDETKFDRECNVKKIREKLNLKDDDFLVLFAGRLIPEKGILELINAIKKCNDSSIKLLIIGSNFYNKKINDSFNNRLKQSVLSIRNNVIFTGYIDYSEMYSYYKSADLAVLPSVWEEPAGLTMLEALISNCPLISTNIGGIPEYVGKTNSILLNVDDELTDNISKYIKYLKNNPDELDKMKHNNMMDDYNLENYYNGFLRCIEGDNK